MATTKKTAKTADNGKAEQKSPQPVAAPSVITKRIGLILGNEYAWPASYEAILKKLNLSLPLNTKRLQFEVERVTIEPFNLRQPVNYNLCIDRLGYWHMTVREWLKKACLMNGSYLINNPFTFQSMEKHSAYCVMIRLGYKIPETWMIPQKAWPQNDARAKTTTETYHRLFDLDEIVEKAGGYPVFMKPYDGGGWRDVTRIKDSAELHKAYDASGEQTMHIQKGVDNFDVFVRCLGCGPQIHAMKYDPSQPLHKRYVVDHNFLTEEEAAEMISLTKLINCFFRWEYNSCEALIKDHIIYPIDFANATPDTSLISLHYNFPWAIKALLRWSIFCAATERKMQLDLEHQKFFDIADKDISHKEKVKQYDKLTEEYYQTDKFNDFCARHLSHLDEVAYEYFTGSEWDEVLQERIRRSFPHHEHGEFTEHYRGLIGYWAKTERDRLDKKDGKTAVVA